MPQGKKFLSTPSARRATDLIEQYNLTSEEANRIYDELLQIEQNAQNKED